MKMSKEEIKMGLAVIEARERLDKIREVIERVENRCMAADGPVTNTRYEMADEELREIYRLSKNAQKPRDLLDAAMLIKRMAHRLKVNAEYGAFPAANLKMASQATGWLQRRGLAGSILRKE